jgi:hypothetical protein
MGRAAFSHYVIFRGGVGCWLASNPAWTDTPVLIANGENPPTKFVCDRAAVRKPKYASIYAHRRACRAIINTEKFIANCTANMASDVPFCAAVLAGNKGHWSILPVKCPPKPKTTPASS